MKFYKSIKDVITIIIITKKLKYFEIAQPLNIIHWAAYMSTLCANKENIFLIKGEIKNVA